eukprot:1142407-Pelagomonas_calceolata.AAC.2
MPVQPFSRVHVLDLCPKVLPVAPGFHVSTEYHSPFSMLRPVHLDMTNYIGRSTMETSTNNLPLHGFFCPVDVLDPLKQMHEHICRLIPVRVPSGAQIFAQSLHFQLTLCLHSAHITAVHHPPAQHTSSALQATPSCTADLLHRCAQLSSNTPGALAASLRVPLLPWGLKAALPAQPQLRVSQELHAGAPPHPVRVCACVSVCVVYKYTTCQHVLTNEDCTHACKQHADHSHGCFSDWYKHVRAVHVLYIHTAPVYYNVLYNPVFKVSDHIPASFLLKYPAYKSDILGVP